MQKCKTLEGMMRKEETKTIKQMRLNKKTTDDNCQRMDKTSKQKRKSKERLEKMNLEREETRRDETTDYND